MTKPTAPPAGAAPPEPGEVILEATGLARSFGGLQAVSDVSLSVRRGEIVGLLGPNGAGKTTIFQILSGFLRPTAGSVVFQGRRIDRAGPAAICRLGLARTFQIVEVFPSLTVGEALRAAAFACERGRAALQLALATAETVGLAAKFDVLCRDLTLAEQKTLEIGKALATQPQLVLLDEVMAELRPTEAAAAVALIRRLRDSGITFLLVEHIMDVVMALADRVVVIAAGRRIAEGRPDEIVANPAVIDVYLGREISFASVAGISAGYGAFAVLHDVALSVEAGELVAVVGVNGAGKTTLMRCIAGLLRPQSGTIAVDGQALVAGVTEAAVAAGVVLVPEGRLVFARMTVWENLLLGGVGRRARPHREASLRRVFALFPRLEERRDQRAGTLSGGEQQMLAIGRGLMAMPKILILDEPSLGLSPIAIQETFLALRELNRSGLTILLVEQNVRLSLAIAGRAYVIENGRMTLSGPAADLARDDRIRKAYLGL